jgi:hypothetical protein
LRTAGKRNTEGLDCAKGGYAVIRQAISCDICGAEKRETNHWFMAYEQSGELRVSAWSSDHRLRPGTKHLCGQACVHKLADEFMARTLGTRTQRPAAEERGKEPLVEVEPLTRVLTLPPPKPPQTVAWAESRLVATPVRR